MVQKAFSRIDPTMFYFYYSPISCYEADLDAEIVTDADLEETATTCTEDSVRVVWLVFSNSF